MKLDWGIYLGCITGAAKKVNEVGSLSNFEVWEIVLITFFLIAYSIIGGIVGAIAQETIKQVKSKWNGKTRGQKLFTLG